MEIKLLAENWTIQRWYLMLTKLTFSDIFVLRKTASSLFMTGLIFHKLILIALIMLRSVNYFLIFSHIRFCVQSIPDELIAMQVFITGLFQHWHNSISRASWLPNFPRAVINWGQWLRKLAKKILRKLWSAWSSPAGMLGKIKSSHTNLFAWDSATGLLWLSKCQHLGKARLSPKSAESREHCRRGLLPSQGSKSLCRFLPVPTDQRKSPVDSECVVACWVFYVQEVGTCLDLVLRIL